RSRGCVGLVATNSVAQGDTRHGGLAWICEHGGAIYSAIRRYRWPGQAAVIVSIIHVYKDECFGIAVLDGEQVERITAYLFKRGGNPDPIRLPGRNELFSIGSIVRGTGFVIGDSGEPTSIREMEEILRHSPKSRERIYPYIGGEELNQSPTQTPHRYVIYLSDIKAEDELSKWPDLARLVREKVKPERDALGANPNNIPLKRRWWAYHAERAEFYERVRVHERVMVTARVGQHAAFAFLPSNMIFSEQIVLFTM